MEAPTCNQTLEVITALYGETDARQKEIAAKWLEEFQKSMYAWKISDELLYRRADPCSCYLAAQTLRRKIETNFHELPESSHSSLKDSLMNHLQHDWSTTIVTQLSLAVVDLALLMAQWQTSVTDIMARFTSYNDPSSCFIMLEILTVFPEEIDSKHLKIGHNRRSEIINQLKCQAGTVLQILSDVLRKHNENVILCQLFRCLASWIQSDLLPPICPILLTELLPPAFEIVMNSDSNVTLCETAREAITQTLFHLTNPEASEISWFCATRIFASHQVLHQMLNSEDTEHSNILCRLVCDFGEANISKILATPGQGLGDLRTLDLVLLCTQHHDYEVAELSFYFWQELSSAIYHSDCEQTQRLLKPYILRLLACLCQHCHFEPDRENLPDKDEDFALFRERCSELVKDVIFIVGSQNCMTLLRDQLIACPGDQWSPSEAILFLMSAIAANVLPKENVVIPSIVDHIFAMPDDTHMIKRHTAIRLVGELSEWFMEHPNLIERCFQFILRFLQPPFIDVAAPALRKLCSHCRVVLRSHAPLLLNVALSLNAAASQEAFGELVESVTMILDENKDYERLSSLLETHLKPLDDMVKNPHHKIVKKDHVSHPSFWTDRIVLIFRKLDCSNKSGNECSIQTRSDPNHVLVLAQRTLSTLTVVIDRFNSDSNIMEKTCRAIRYVVRSLSTHSAPLLEPIANRIISAYTAYPHSCFLYLTSILVDVFAGIDTCLPGLMYMVEAFAGRTMTIITCQESLKENPDTVEDFHRLCSRCVQKAPVAFMKSSCFNRVFEFSMSCVPIAHREANTSVMRFLSDVLTCDIDAPDVNDKEFLARAIQLFLIEYGSRVVTSLLRAVILDLPTYLSHDVSAVLFDIRARVNSEQFAAWLHDAISTLPSTGTGGSITLFPTQVQDFLQSSVAAKDIKHLRNTIKGLVRLYN